MAHTIGLEPGLILLFDQFRKKRGISGDGGAGMVPGQEAAKMYELANGTRVGVEEWRRIEHLQLLK